MLKYAISVTLLFTLVFSSCNKKLSKEEQQVLLHEMKEREIMRVTDEQLMERLQFNIDSLNKIYNETNKIPESTLYAAQYVSKLTELKTEKEKEIYEVYRMSVENQVTPPNNLQKTQNGDFLYCIPLIETGTTDSIYLTGIYYLKFSKKELIKEMINKE